MRPRLLLTLLPAVAAASLAGPPVRAGSFDDRFEQIKKNASREQLYQLLFDLPKGGDLHHHLNQSILAEAWLRGALNAERSHGNAFYTRVRIGRCPEEQGRPVRFHTVQRATYRGLPECQRRDYEPLSALTPDLQEEWLSALRIDRPGEGREEFFEVLSTRLGDLSKDPRLVPDLLVDNMRRFAAEGVRYLEVQVAGPRFVDLDGRPLPPERCAALLDARLAQPDARATGVAVRFQVTVVRFRPEALQDLERAFARVAVERDLWVGVNLAGREDDQRGQALRFLDTVRRLRRSYGGVRLAIHAGEDDGPGPQVRNTLLLGAARIGHGINLISDPETLLRLRDWTVLVEINLISNHLLGYVPDLAAHPFPEYLRLGVPVCLNTDDRGAWDSSLTDEYFTAVTTFNLTWRELVQLGRNSLLHAFAEPALKARLLSDYEAAVGRYEQRYGAGDWQRALRRVRPDVSGYARRKLSIALWPQDSPGRER